MKTSIQAALIASAAVLLAACATGDEMSRSAPQASYPAPGQLVENTEYIAMVEQVALRRGVQVHWINQPTKRVPRDERAAARR
jgi:hypothetical protein